MQGPVSIDINRLISQEKYQSHTAAAQVVSPIPSFPPELSRLFFPLFDEQTLVRLTTNFSPGKSSDSLVFVLKFEKNSFILEEEKQSRTRAFKLDVQKSFLTINNRRALSEDFQLYTDRLKLLGVMMQKLPLIWWSKSTTQSTDSGGIKLELPHALDFPEKEGFVSSASLSEKLSAEAAELLLKISRVLSIKKTAVSNPTSMENEGMLIPALENLRDQLKTILPDSLTKAVITNAKKINLNLQTLFCLSVTEDKTSYIEKSTAQKNHFELNMVKLDATLNKQPLSRRTLEWFVQKLRQAGQDLATGKAEMYKTKSSATLS